MLRRISAGTSPRTTTSDTATRPPGFSTRNASRSTASLSLERLMTQFEMITSTELSGSGIAAIEPFRNWTFVAAACRGFSRRGASIEAVDLAGRPDALGRQQDVDTAARAQIKHRLPGLELDQRRRIAAAKRGGHGRGGQAARLGVRVQIRRDGIAAARCRTATARVRR